MGNLFFRAAQHSTESLLSKKRIQMLNFSCVEQVEAGSDAPSESKVDQRVVLPAENGLSHTPIIAPKAPSVVSHQPQPAGTSTV